MTEAAKQAAEPAEKDTYSMSPGFSHFLGANRIGLPSPPFRQVLSARPQYR
jgi:hypothetical protein